jgi:hypothetical protein
MKKILFINLLACIVLCLTFLYSSIEKTTCSLQYPSTPENIKHLKNKIQGGAEADEQFFQFNRIFIKI